MKTRHISVERTVCQIRTRLQSHLDRFFVTTAQYCVCKLLCPPLQEVLLKRAADLVEALYGMPHNNQVSLHLHPWLVSSRLARVCLSRCKNWKFPWSSMNRTNLLLQVREGGGGSFYSSLSDTLLTPRVNHPKHTGRLEWKCNLQQRTEVVNKCKSSCSNCVCASVCVCLRSCMWNSEQTERVCFRVRNKNLSSFRARSKHTN